MRTRTIIGIASAFITILATTAGALTADPSIVEAAKQGHLDEVRALIKQKRDVNAVLGDGTTALHWAVLNGDINVTRVLLAAGAAPGLASRVGSITPLLTAAETGNGPIVIALLIAKADPNLADVNGATPLMAAAASGSVDAVKALLDHGAKIEAVETVHGQNALMFAASHDRADVIRYLIAHGADAKATSKVVKLGRAQFDEDGNPIGGDTAVGAGGGGGAGRGRRQRTGDGTAAPGAPGALSAEDIAALLGDPGDDVPDAAPRRRRGATTDDGSAAPAQGAGAPAGAPGAGGGTGAPGAAAGARQRPAGAAGGGGGRRASAVTIGGNTALQLAARDGNYAAVQALVEAKVDVNQPNAGDKTTPIISAICNGHYDIAKFLLDYGADPNQVSIDGLAPLYAAIDAQYAPQTWTPNAITGQEQSTYLDLMKALIDKGANVNAKLTKKLWFRPTHHDECWIGTAGSTPFWRAAQANDKAAMQLLVAHGADPKVVTADGDNALMVAAGLGWNGNFTIQTPTPAIEVVKYCLELGVGSNLQDAQGYTAICGAAYRGDNELIKLLIAHGAKLDTHNQRGWSVTDMANGPSLRSSVPVKHPEAVALLLKLGAPALTATDDEEILGIIRRRAGAPGTAKPGTVPGTASATGTGAGTVPATGTTPATGTVPATKTP